ncbi:hypothetical protein GCM10010400_51860 [Streptomyces aculeolatus]
MQEGPQDSRGEWRYTQLTLNGGGWVYVRCAQPQHRRTTYDAVPVRTTYYARRTPHYRSIRQPAEHRKRW